MLAWITLLVIQLPAVCRADTQNYGNLTVSIDEPLEGDSGYGYLAYRVTISNRSTQTHRVRIHIPGNSYGYGYGDSIDRITRTVDVEPGVATRFELLQPPLPIQGHGAAIYIDGARQRQDVNVGIRNHAGGYNKSHVVLASRDVSSGVKDTIDKAIEDATTGASKMGGYGGMGMGGYGYSGREEYTLAREPRPVGEWGTSWLGYTRYMAVMMTDSDFKALPSDVADALRSYVLTGGVLGIIHDGAEPVELQGWWRAWSPTQVPSSAPSWGASGAGGVSGGGSAIEYGLGRIHLASVTDADALDSKQWMDQLDAWRDFTAARATVRDTEQANREMPVVEGQITPARGLLLVMLLFTLTIGPINIVALWMMKKPMLLLWTVPGIALVFSAAVMIYALLSEGITPHARTFAVTLLDQSSHHAVSLGVHGYYAPLTPGNGLWFDADTCITPQVEGGYYYGSSSGQVRSIDETHGQHLTTGWVVARVPAHLAVRKSETRHERLDVSFAGDGTPTVVNGLGSDITNLTLVDAQNRTWSTQNLTAGQTAAMTPTNSVNASGDNTPALTKIITNDWNAVQHLTKAPTDYLAPGAYLAELAGSPFLEPGIEGLKEHRTECVVVGYYGEAE
jgi:hypothetical protein